MALTGRPPKPTDQRHTYYKRPEIGLLEAPKPDGRVVPLVPKAPKGLSAASRKRASGNRTTGRTGIRGSASALLLATGQIYRPG